MEHRARQDNGQDSSEPDTALGKEPQGKKQVSEISLVQRKYQPDLQKDVSARLEEVGRCAAADWLVYALLFSNMYTNTRTRTRVRAREA
jgi:hypothetical protein